MMEVMVRWQPGARERLQEAALKRFAEQGFEGTTVAQIAETAGLTERTFFRYFADKREVLFRGHQEFQRVFLTGIENSGSSDPMAMIAAALHNAATLFPNERRPWSRARNAVISSDPSLRERELLKMSALATAMTEALQQRGVGATAAALAAESGVAVFRVAFANWIADDGQRSIIELEQEAFAELKAVVNPAEPSGGRGRGEAVLLDS
jgi:AcrR family transcriptional regulator